VQPIAYQIDLYFPGLTPFSLACLFLSIVASLSFVLIFLFRRRMFFRLSMAVALMLHVFFQWPLFIISGVIAESLSNKYWPFLVVQFSIFSLLAFSIFSDKYVGPDFFIKERKIRPSYAVFLTLLGVGLVYLFLKSLPFECTALYAIAFDPEVALLAREISIKFNDSRVATISYGALTNVVAPAIISLSAMLIFFGEKHGRVLRATLALASIVLAVFSCLLTGTKGLLLPSLIVAAIVMMVSARGFMMKISAGVVSVLIILFALWVFETVRDRVWTDTGSYPYGECSAVLGGHEENQKLISSLYHRKHALNLSVERLNMLHNELNRVHDKFVAAPEINWKIEERPGTSSSYFYAIMYRALVSPMQVAAWHYLYIEEEDNPGWLAMPFAKYFLGSFVNAPEDVHQKYGSVFSEGDKTSTSTAPVGFILGYPAYLGWLGLLMALLAVMIVDVVTAVLLKRISGSVFPVCVGLLYVVGFNFSVSDFATSMITHGGVFVIMIFLVFGFMKNMKIMRLKITRN